MPGDTLNLNTLASGLDSGGPAPLRGVELASEFGTNLFREQLDTSTLLPSCVSPYTNTTACGPSALDFSSYDPVIGQAAAKAAALGVTFEVQVAQGNALEKGLVASGLWQADIQAIATHFATSAPDLTYFEAWNEPNDTWGPASTYVSQVLAPFYAGIQAANMATGRHDLVVGGTVVGSNLSYWQQIAAAGGFADLNVVGVHPYTGYDDSYEEDNIPVFLQDLKTLMSDNGAGSDPIFNTEQGWWSDGTAAFSDAAGWAASAFMWNKSLGITNWNYFMYEGSYTDGDGSFSLIQGANVDDYVKPDGIALMTVSNVLGGRHFIAMVPTGIPHTYAMEFGPSATSTSSIVAIWTDDLSTTADVSLTTGSATLSVTGTLGQASSLSVASGTQTQLGVSGSPQYISVPSGSTLTINAPESFGADVALGAGTTASASSVKSGKSASDSIRSTTDITGATEPNATSERGNDYGGWIANASDSSPTVAVTFPAPQSVDRVLVSTASLGSVMPGLRDYKVQLDEGGTWTTVASVTNEFFSRMELLSFPSVTATGVQVTISSINAGGAAGGEEPWFWNSNFLNEGAVYSVEAYGPGTAESPSQSVLFTSTPPTGASVGGAYVPAATATSGLPVALSVDSSASSVCAISAGTVSFIGAGTCVLDANQAGNADYYPAPQVQQSFSVRATPSPSSGPASPTHSGAYWEVSADGGLFAFGDAKFYGSMGGTRLNSPVVAMAETPDGQGYWEVSADGGLFAFGDAKFYGSMGGTRLNSPVVAMAETPDGQGYWEVSADGGLFAFGDAKFYGSMGGTRLNSPVVAMAETPDGQGYWEVSADGGLFAFGDAKFYGSMGGTRLNSPVVAMAETPDGQGYWEVSADGGLFAFGDAKFYGSMGGTRLNSPVVAMAETPDGQGYWEVSADGGLFAFGDAGFYGSMGGTRLNSPVVGMAVSS